MGQLLHVIYHTQYLLLYRTRSLSMVVHASILTPSHPHTPSHTQTLTPSHPHIPTPPHPLTPSPPHTRTKFSIRRPREYIQPIFLLVLDFSFFLFFFFLRFSFCFRFLFVFVKPLFARNSSFESQTLIRGRMHFSSLGLRGRFQGLTLGASRATENIFPRLVPSVMQGSF